jgi:putative ABC transport system ATP-binding protein
MLTRMGSDDVRFYEPEELNPAAPVRDNLLFGRVNERIADARERVRQVGAEVIDELALREDIEKVGLDHQAGPAGRLLTAPQRASINLLRCVVRRPDILVVDGALAALGEQRAAGALDLLLEESAGRTLAIVLPGETRAGSFEAVVRFTEGGVAVENPVRDPAAGTAPAAAAE